MSVLAIPEAASAGGRRHRGGGEQPARSAAKLERPRRAEQNGAAHRERRLFRRYERGTEPLDDLVQVASVGLVKAIDRFDPTRGPDFISYAIPTMLGELKRYFRDASWALHVPRGMQERVLNVSEAAEYLSQKLGRSPSAKELATQLGMSVEDVLEAMEASLAYCTLSLDLPPGKDENDRPSPVASAGEEDKGFDLAENRLVLAGALRLLPPRERRILLLRFQAGLTQAEIGERLGMSQMHVSRLARRALERLSILAHAEAA